MKTLILAALTLSTVTLQAKGKMENTALNNPTGCPVLIDSFGHTPLNYPFGNFEVRYKNQSDKNVIGVSFHIDTMSPTGDFIPTLQGVEYGGVMKPGKQTTSRSDLPEFNYKSSLYRRLSGGRMYVTKVAFADGTTWEDDGTGSCRLVYDDRKGIE